MGVQTAVVIGGGNIFAAPGSHGPVWIASQPITMGMLARS